MKLYTIEVCACGRITFHDVNCPDYWRGSGVYDVEYEVHREFRHYVSAMNLDRALKLVARYWFKEDPDWCDLDCVLYNPDTIKEEEDREANERLWREIQAQKAKGMFVPSWGPKYNFKKEDKK